MKARILIITAAMLLSACAGSRMPLDAAVWRAGGIGPYGVGTAYPQAQSVSDYFAAGGAPYRGLCGRLVTGVADACTSTEMREFPQAARWREVELPAAQARSASALAVTIGGK